MKANQPNHDRDDARWDENDPVWRLLGESPRPEPDAWFTVRTLARCRLAGVGAESGARSFGAIWRWALGGGLGACFAVMLLFMQVPSTTPVPDQQKNVQEAFEVVASLDSSDSDSSSTSSWQDSSSSY